MSRRATPLALVLTCLIAACSQQESPPVAEVEPSPPATPAAKAAPVVASVTAQTAGDERAVLDDYLAAINSHDPEQAGALLDEKVHYFDAFTGQIQRNRLDAVKKVLDLYQDAVPDGHWEIRSEPAVGSGTIAYEWTFTGTNTGSWGGIGASGQKIDLKGISFVRIANGKIIYKADYFDTTTLGKQLGWQ